ncbi:MAG: hypothetical protein AMXMBFR61_18270 [Fimbriimonadales bacterium]
MYPQKPGSASRKAPATNNKALGIERLGHDPRIPVPSVTAFVTDSITRVSPFGTYTAALSSERSGPENTRSPATNGQNRSGSALGPTASGGTLRNHEESLCREAPIERDGDGWPGPASRSEIAMRPQTTVRRGWVITPETYYCDSLSTAV